MICRILRATAIGDAFGAGYEYAPQDEVAGFTLASGFRQHHKHAEIQPGMWTDDTMMSIAAARALVTDMNRQEKPEKKSPRGDTLLQAMVDLHTAHRTAGYSKHMLAALDGATTGPELRTIFEGNPRSDSNGAAMRSAIYGVLPSLPRIRDATWRLSSLTHQGSGISGAQAVAGAVHFLRYHGGPVSEMKPYLAEWMGALWTLRWTDRVRPQNGPLGLITVAAALTIVSESQSLTEVIERSIRIGGDVDTVAAIAMAIACNASPDDIADDLPPGLWEGEGIVPVAGLEFSAIAALDAEIAALAEADGLGLHHEEHE